MTARATSNTQSIASIRVAGLRPFTDVELRVPTAARGEGQWIVLLGENGGGKSTLLRGIALALAEPDLAKAVLAGSSAPYVRGDHGVAEVTVEAGDDLFQARIEVHEGSEVITTQSERRAPGWLRRPLVFAYGCRRGSALGGADREVDFPPISDLATLFDEGPALIHAETWLKQLRLDAALNPGTDKERRFAAVIEAVRDLLPGVERIEVLADHVWFEGPGVGRAPLAALSDGYVTTIGWIVDLLARWYHRATRQGWPIEVNFMAHMQGVVLLDEIDLHLHPRWQVSVIDEVRARFPRMNFIVTTHNPLTLLGARPGEIHVLRRRGEAIDVLQLDIPPGLRADQVLTGEWFGLASTLDPGTLGLLEQHRAMLLEKISALAPERVALEAELRRRLGGFGETSLERLAQSVAAELLGGDARTLGPEDRRKLHAKVLAHVAARSTQEGASAVTSASSATRRCATALELAQTLHGYTQGHRLLAQGGDLRESELHELDRLSDLSGYLPAGATFDAYHTGFPCGRYYALACTWPDNAAPRRGTVLTHTLLIPVERWLAAADPFVWLSLHRRPAAASDSAAYSESLSEATDPASVRPPLAPDVLRGLLALWFGQPQRPLLWESESPPLDVVAALWPWLWTELRAHFTFCTFALQARTHRGRPFDFLGVPPEALGAFLEFSASTAWWRSGQVRSGEPDPWVDALADAGPEAVHELLARGRALGLPPPHPGLFRAAQRSWELAEGARLRLPAARARLDMLARAWPELPPDHEVVVAALAELLERQAAAPLSPRPLWDLSNLLTRPVVRAHLAAATPLAGQILTCLRDQLRDRLTRAPEAASEALPELFIEAPPQARELIELIELEVYGAGPS